VTRRKVIAIVEARVVTGPAKNILRFATDNRDRVDLTVVTFARSSDKSTNPAPNNQFVSTARSVGLPVEIIPETGPFDLSVRTALRQICDRHVPDIVQTHGVKSHFILSLLRKKPFRWIAFHHGYTKEDFKMRVYNQFDRWSLKASDLVVTVCGEFASRLVARGVSREQIVVIPNSVPHDFIQSDARASEQTRARLAISDDERVVLAIGRLSPEKGHRYLIDAIAGIASLAPELKLQVLIAGTGPCETRLKEQISRLGLARHVRMMGYCSDIRPLLSIADLLVLPSLSEGSPNVLLESIAARVPIVASNVGGVPELLNDTESAVLVPPANTQALTKSICELLLDRSKAKHLAKTAFERARLMFTPEIYDERVLDLYARAVSRKRIERIH
jgi:glycosyltransferase involved in cell wall biosynthesis